MRKRRLELRQFHLMRERELEDHGAILGEIQQKYGKERTKCEQLERQIAELYKKLHDNESKIPFSDKRIKELLEQIKAKDHALGDLKKKVELTPTAQMLKDEIANLKDAHHVEISEVRSKHTNHSENIRLKESRLHTLEGKLEEMTTQIAQQEFDKVRLNSSLETLRTQLEAAERENEVLKESFPRKDDTVAVTREEKETAEHKLNRFKALADELKLSGDVDLTEFLGFRSSSSSSYNDFDSRMCSSCDSTRSDFLQLKATVGELRNKLQHAQSQLEESKTNATKVESELYDRISAMEHNHSTALRNVETKMRDKVNEVESEMQKHRHRTMEVVADKDRELEATKAILVSFRSQQINSSNVPVDPTTPVSVKLLERSKSTRARRTRSSGSFDAAPIPESPSSVTEFGDSFNSGHLSASFTRSNTLGDESKNVYYEEIISEKDREIMELRMKIRMDDSKIRDIEQNVLTKDLQHYEIIEKLKEELRSLEGKLQLYKTDAEPSIEYLRNIFIQYLQCSSSSGRRNILKAMATVLKLSPAETKRIEHIK
ncbi:hypothetical protein L596_015056 [Steinernema carpocapsae]|uniref:GRIP domain-containing protein n=1 Tax=Steinernema carpocapsae TaxID=34508 RepID=A0A4U5NED5_STECR|nr:hypothetical protein L596_015056 [Steinernema carpocapsae]